MKLFGVLFLLDLYLTHHIGKSCFIISEVVKSLWRAKGVNELRMGVLAIVFLSVSSKLELSLPELMVGSLGLLLIRGKNWFVQVQKAV